MYLLQPVDETETRDTPGNVSLLTSSIFSHSTEFHGNSFKHSLTSFRSNKPIFSFGKFSASRKQNRNKRNRVLYYNLDIYVSIKTIARSFKQNLNVESPAIDLSLYRFIFRQTVSCILRIDVSSTSYSSANSSLRLTDPLAQS